MLKAAPLSTTFMFSGMIGFVISVMYIVPSVSPTWGIALGVVFLSMLIASIWSMTTSDISDEDLVPEAHRNKKKRRK